MFPPQSPQQAPQGQPQPGGSPMPPPPQQVAPQPPQGQGQPNAAPPGIPPDVVTIDAVMRLLRDNPLRRFRMDIEADSTIAGDESQEKQDRAELISSLTKLIETWGPIVQAQPLMAPLAAELMQFGVRAFRVGRSLETIIEETSEKFIEASGQPKPPPQPSPDDLIKLKGIQAKVEAEIVKAKIGVQQTQMDAQASMADHHVNIAGIQAQSQADQQKAQNDARQTQLEANADKASLMMKNQVEEMRFRRAVEAENAPDKN
jgi:hypothetical protein